MLTIRAGQIEEFDRAYEADLLRVGMEHVREELPELTATLDDETLRLRVRQGIDRARSLGLDGPVESVAFLDAGLLLDDVAFDAAPEHDWAAEILANPFMTPCQKGLALLDLAWVEQSDDSEV